MALRVSPGLEGRSDGKLERPRHDHFVPSPLHACCAQVGLVLLVVTLVSTLLLAPAGAADCLPRVLVATAILGRGSEAGPGGLVKDALLADPDSSRRRNDGIANDWLLDRLLASVRLGPDVADELELQILWPEA
jgi:hypothetical protein